MSAEERPRLTKNLSGAELMRWYWLKDELVGFARDLGIRATGSKELLTERIAAHLDGVPFVEPRRAGRSSGRQLAAPLTGATVIPRGQRCSQVVRAWLESQVGPSFSFDAAMRRFFAETDGTQTMQDALDHYRATRGQASPQIGSQFEYNRFTRAWYETHPHGDREDLVNAWQEYRTTPVERRGRI